MILCGVISLPALSATDQPNSTQILLSGAKKWVARDRADLARELLKKALIINPSSPEALLMLGKIELRDGKHDEALSYLRALQQTSPDSAGTRELDKAYRLATDDKSSLKKTDVKASEAAHKAIDYKNKKSDESVTGKTAARQTIADKKQKKKNEPKAPSVATESPEDLANNPDIIARTDALDSLADGNTELAEAGLLDVLKRRPQDPEVIGGLGLVKQAQGKFEEAQNWFEQALLAAQTAKVATERWENLIELSKFSQLVSKAKSLLEENRLPEAEAVINQALVIKPGYPDALAVLGNIKAAGKDNIEAERLYREALKTEGYNVPAARGLASLLANTKRGDEAIEFIEHTLHEYEDEWKKSAYGEASLLREEANLFIEANKPSRAMSALETAAKVDPKNPWVRFSLAKLYISLDLIPLGKQVMQEGVALAPEDPVMHYAQALVLLNLDDYTAALDTLNQIPENALTQNMREARNRALIQSDIQQAKYQLSIGNRTEALRIMSIAESQAKNSYSATTQVAEGWFKMGQQDQGLAAMRNLPQPVPLETQVYYASLLNRAKKDQILTDYLPTLHIPDTADETSEKYRKTIRDIEFSMAGRQFDKLMKSGRKEQAQEIADMTLNANKLSNTDYFKFHRRYFNRAKLPGNAIPLLNQEKEQNPDDLNIRLELAYALHQDKQNSKAKSETQELLLMTKDDDTDMRLRIASLQQDIGDTSGARTTINDLISRYPKNTDLLLQAGRLAQSDNQYNRAMSYYKRALQPAETTKSDEKSTPSDTTLNLTPDNPALTDANTLNKVAPALTNTSESSKIYQRALATDTVKGQAVTSPAVSDIEQAMDSIRALRSPKIETGLDIETKTSGSGTSTYNATEIPVLARFPIGYEAHGTVQVDRVNIDAGTLSPALADASLFGTIRSYLYVPPVQTLTPSASGTSIALGYEEQSFKADIGKIGLGFPVSNTVGGMGYGGAFGRLSYSLNLSRRPYTGTLLSYAGAKDPITGNYWGGVTNTGVSLYLSTTLTNSVLGDFNLSSGMNYGLLRGQNVLNNDRVSLSATIDHDIYASDDMLLNLGLNMTYMSFSKNENFYTYGHGGYYSPQSSIQLGIPFELTGRADMLTYQLQAGVTYAKTQEDTALYYPTDPALQAMAAAAGTLPVTYNGGSGGGFGYNLLAASEYRATPNFIFGGRFSMNRSAYYAPNSFFFYLRYVFKPETGEVSMRPNPVIPYSQY